jgi:hypothetical protein
LAALEQQDSGKQLAWEARHRTRAAIAGIAGGVCLLAYFLLEQVILRDVPKVSGLETLIRVTQPGNIATLPSLRTPYFTYLDSKSGMLLVRSLFGLVGFSGLAWATGFLGVATRARVPTFRRYMIYLPIIGGVVVGLGVLVSQIANQSLISDFLASPRRVEDVPMALTALGKFAGILTLLGTLLLAVGLVFVSLNAIRAGLLNKLLGYIGIIVGAGTILNFLVILAVIEVFWLIGISLVFLGVWPGEFPAWRTGKAEPWPAGPRAARAGGVRPAPAPAAPRAQGAPQARRKRKKRH